MSSLFPTLLPEAATRSLLEGLVENVDADAKFKEITHRAWVTRAVLPSKYLSSNLLGEEGNLKVKITFTVYTGNLYVKVGASQDQVYAWGVSDNCVESLQELFDAYGAFLDTGMMPVVPAHLRGAASTFRNPPSWDVAQVFTQFEDSILMVGPLSDFCRSPQYQQCLPVVINCVQQCLGEHPEQRDLLISLLSTRLGFQPVDQSITMADRPATASSLITLTTGDP